MADKLRLYNFANVGPDRQWLQDTLLTDTSDSSPDDDSCDVTEDHLREMLKQHVYTKKYRSKFYNRHSVSSDSKNDLNIFKIYHTFS